MALNIRRFQPSDDLEKLTVLVRSAYAPHASSGLQYWGTYQTVEDTARRFASGIGLVAEEAEEYVGTAVLRPPQLSSPVELYRKPNVWSISQFCIAPKFKGKGYGKLLHTYAVDVVRQQGAEIIALDTAQPAQALIDMYGSWGYKVVGTCDWRPSTNYLSVVMAKSLVANNV